MRRQLLVGKADTIVINIIVAILLGVSTIAMLYPFVNVIAVAFSSYKAYVTNPLRIFPGEFTLKAFTYVFGSKMLLRSYLNTIIVTVGGTGISLVLTTLFAYSLSKAHLGERESS